VLLGYIGSYRGYSKKSIPDADVAGADLQNYIPPSEARRLEPVTVADVGNFPISFDSAHSSFDSPCNWDSGDDQEVDQIPDPMARDPNIPNLREMIREQKKKNPQVGPSSQRMPPTSASGEASDDVPLILKRKPRDPPQEVPAATNLPKKSKTAEKAKAVEGAAPWRPSLLVNGIDPITVADSAQDLAVTQTLTGALMLPKDIEPYAGTDLPTLMRSVMAHEVFVSILSWLFFCCLYLRFHICLLTSRSCYRLRKNLCCV
jgi:hypothetical protein